MKLKQFDKVINNWEKNTNIELDLINREKIKRLFLERRYKIDKDTGLVDDNLTITK